MPTLVPPPLAASDWTFRVTKIETEEVPLPWSPVEGWPSWQPGRTFAVVQMTAETMDACAIPERDLIGKGFVLHGLQHRILRVLDTIPLRVRTQAWPVAEVAS